MSDPEQMADTIQKASAAILWVAELLEASRRVASSTTADGDWECVRASDLQRLRHVLHKLAE